MNYLHALAAGSRAPHLNEGVGDAGSGHVKAEETTKLPAPGDKDRVCFVKRPEENSTKKAVWGGGSGQNAIIYPTIKCRGASGGRIRPLQT